MNQINKYKTCFGCFRHKINIPKIVNIDKIKGCKVLSNNFKPSLLKLINIVLKLYFIFSIIDNLLLFVVLFEKS